MSFDSFLAKKCPDIGYNCISDFLFWPNSERLRILGLTTLAERRSRGDLIEVYKASQGLSQLSGVLNFSESGLNILCKQGKCKDSKINRVRRNFLNERVTFFFGISCLLK